MLEMSSTRVRSEMQHWHRWFKTSASSSKELRLGLGFAISADGERVLASSSEIKEVVRMALEAVEDRPLVIRVPAASSTFVF